MGYWWSTFKDTGYLGTTARRSPRLMTLARFDRDEGRRDQAEETPRLLSHVPKQGQASIAVAELRRGAPRRLTRGRARRRALTLARSAVAEAEPWTTSVSRPGRGPY